MKKLNDTRVRAMVGRFLIGTLLAVISISSEDVYALNVYPDWQVENDLSFGITYEYATDSEHYLYVKPDYVSSSDLSQVGNIESFYSKMLALGKDHVPEPRYIPIGVNGLPVFIPLYEAPKQVGDQYVQRIFVLNQFNRALGVRVIDQGTFGSELEQINYLYDAAIRFAQDHQLVFGQKLPEALWNQEIYGDLIWPEIREVNGEEVVVPIVYLTSASIENFKIDEHLTILEGENAVLGSINIAPSAVMKLRADYLQVVDKLTVGGTLDVDEKNKQIIIGGALDVYGGSVNANMNLNVAANAVRLRPTVSIQKTRFGERQVIGSIARVDAANGKVTLHSYSDLSAIAAQVNANEVTLSANGDIYIGAQPLQSMETRHTWGGSYSQSKVEYAVSKISGEEAVRLIAGGSIEVVASELVSDRGIVEILAENGVYIENEYGVVQEQMHRKLGNTTEDMSKLQTFAIQANLKAGRGVHINTEAGPIVLRAADIMSEGDVELNAKNGAVHLLIAVEQDQYNYSRVSEGLLTIKTEMESWDRDTAVYTTITGGLEINATRGLTVEYGGVEGTTMDQVEALKDLPGMGWLNQLDDYNDCALVHGNQWTPDLSPSERESLVTAQPCIDYSFIQLLDDYEYNKSTNLSPAAMAVIAVAVSVATGGAGSGPMAAAMSAAQSTLLTQAIQVSANTFLNGGSPYDAWKALGSDENIRQLATAMVTAGALAYADDLMSLEEISLFTAGSDDGLNLLGQTAEVVAHSTVSAGIDVLASGESLSDFGSNFQDAFESSLATSVVREIGEDMAGRIGDADLNSAIRYISHAALGCITQSALASSSEEAELKCYSGGAGAVLGEFLALQQKADTEAEMQLWLEDKVLNDIPLTERDVSDQYDKLVKMDVDLAKLSAALTAFVLDGDVTAAATGAATAAFFNANHDLDERKANAWKMVEKIKLANGITLYVYYDADGDKVHSDKCPAAVKGCGPGPDTLTPAEEELLRQKEAYYKAKHEHWVNCYLKELMPCNFNTAWGGSISDEARQEVDSQWNSSPGQQRLQAIQREWVRIRDHGGEGLALFCEFLGACSIAYEATKIAETGEITTSSMISIAAGAAGPIGFITKRADDAIDTSRVIPGLGREVRRTNPDFPPLEDVSSAMRTSRVQRMAQDVGGTDCSEIAAELFKASGEKGKILEILPNNKYQLNVYELGTVEPGQWYHQVYTDGKYVYDPRAFYDPIPFGDWENHIRRINPDGVKISDKLTY